MIAVIPGVDVVPILLAWIGVVSLVWTVVHTRYLWRRWRDTGGRPGMMSVGMWMLFASLGIVCVLGVAARMLPDLIAVRAIIEGALLGVTVAVTWLVVQLLRARR